MTKKHFDRAASLVRCIASGGWTYDAPAWAGPTIQPWDEEETAETNYSRAVWTAEAFIMLFEAFNYRFNRDRFLTQCGLKG